MNIVMTTMQCKLCKTSDGMTLDKDSLGDAAKRSLCLWSRRTFENCGTAQRSEQWKENLKQRLSCEDKSNFNWLIDWYLMDQFYRKIWSLSSCTWSSADESRCAESEGSQLLWLTWGGFIEKSKFWILDFESKSEGSQLMKWFYDSSGKL